MSITSANRPEWMMTDLSSIMLGWCSVPIPASIDVKDIEYILNHAEVSVLVASRVILHKILPLLPALPQLRLIVVMDTLSPEEYQSTCDALSSTHAVKHIASRCPPSAKPSATASKSEGSSQSLSMMVVDFEDVVAIGSAHTLQTPNIPANEDETMMTIVYTSGSTGRPKGALNVYARWNSFITFLYLMSSPLVRLSFMPLAHNTERQQSHLTTCFGGKMAFSRGNMARIFEEFALVNPTTISAAPRFYDSIYNQYQATLAQFRQDYPQVVLSQAEQYCLQQYRGILGNAMKVLIVGGAAVSQFTKEFLQKCFQISVFDGYGTTEAGGIAADGKLYPNTTVKIVDVPELGYTADDKPWPRGEVWAKTNTMVLGYYKDPDMTAEAFRDGWFVTGDIVEVRNGNEYYIVDRRKNLFKLAQGVFVAPSAIENKLLVSDFVHQIYVYGDHTRSNLVAVVVPNVTNLAKWCSAHGYLDVQAWVKENCSQEESSSLSSLTPDNIISKLSTARNEAFVQYLCALPVSIAKVHREIVKTANQIELPSYHIPSAITLEHEVWTPENRLVTPTDKPQRASLEKKYKADIERMYGEVAAKEAESSTIVQQVREAVGNVLSADGNAVEGEDLSTNLATDSLSVLKLIHTLNREFGTNLSFMDVMKETGGRLTPELIAEVVQRRSQISKGMKPELDPWALVHPMILSDMDINVPVDQWYINQFYGPGSEEARVINKVLVTGATGFLGFHLVFELLEQYPDIHLYLLVRASSEEEAKARVTETVASKQKRTFTAEQLARISFVVGDIAMPNLGLTEEVWLNLAAEINAIYHVAAAVNWLWGYDTMRAPNVLGTVELLRIALTTRMKYFFYISTVSTSLNHPIVPTEPYSPHQVSWNDNGPLEETSLMDKSICLDRSGYVISKWIAESIVTRAISSGMPGCIMRPGMITGHSQSGACHSTDFCPRLLTGLSQAKIAFKSDLPLEWMPVDFCASAIRALASHYTNKVLPQLIEDQSLGVTAAFNLQNTSMANYTQIISYVKSAGIDVQMKEYQEWRQIVAGNAQSPLWPLLPFFGEGQCSMYAQPIPSPQTNAILKECGVICPAADQKLFLTYIRYLKEERLI